MVAQVQPPLLDKELVDMFMDSLQSSYFERMVGIVSSNFSDLVKFGERIETSLESGRIQGASSSQTRETKSLSSSQEEEEYVINAIMSDVKYSHGAPSNPYDPSSFRWSSVPAPHYPYG